MHSNTNNKSQAHYVSQDGSIVVGIMGPPNIQVRTFKYSDGQFTNIGCFGGKVTIPKAISLNGEYIVGCATTPTSNLEAFKYSDAKGLISLNTPISGILTEATSISSDGSVVVGTSQDVNSGTHSSFMHTDSIGMYILPTFGGDSFNPIISANGLVITGNTILPTSGEQHAYIFNRTNNNLQDLGTLGGNFSESIAISNNGETVVGNSTTASGHIHAFRYTLASGIQDLGTLGGNTSSAKAITPNASVIVGEATISTGAIHAFKYSNNVMKDLGTLGGTNSSSVGVSANGLIVVGNSELSSDKEVHAFVYTDLEGMQDLGTLGGINSTATGISQDGSIIIGYSDTAHGEEHAFIAKVLPKKDPTSIIDIHNTAQALTEDHNNLAVFFANSQESLTQNANSECTSFGPYGFCIRGGSRYISTDRKAQRLTGSASVAYKIDPQYIVGINIDQTALYKQKHYTIKNSMPLTMLYITWEPSSNSTGSKIKILGAYEYGKVTTTRTPLPFTEQAVTTAGTIRSALDAQLSYGFMLQKHSKFRPALGLQYTNTTRKSSQESSQLAFPITYNKASLSILALYGTFLIEKNITKNLLLGLLLGARHTLNNKTPTFSGTIQGLAPFSYPIKTKRTVFSIETTALYTLPYNQSINAQTSYSQSTLNKFNNLSMFISYSLGF